MYEDAIVEAWEKPLHKGITDSSASIATGENSSCGDIVTLALTISDGIIKVARHKVSGCVLCQAGAEMICRQLEGTPGKEFTVESLYGGLPYENRVECCELPIKVLKGIINGK